MSALQLLYSRRYKQRLTEPMLKELEKKVREQHTAWTEDNLWKTVLDTATPSYAKKSRLAAPREGRDHNHFAELDGRLPIMSYDVKK
jgi:hypothetical protein